MMLAFFFTFFLALQAAGVKRSLGEAVDPAQFPSVVLIVGIGSKNVVQHICSGTILNTNGTASHILTTAYCIQTRADPDDATKTLRYMVLVPSGNGTVTLGQTTFAEYTPLKFIPHPQAGQEANYAFDTAFPNGTSTTVNAKIDTNDVGIIRLNNLITVPTAQPVVLSQDIPANGTRVDALGFGGPDFYSLHKTDSLAVIPSSKIVDDQPVPSEILFFRDVVNPGNLSQAVEVGDEGGPIMEMNQDGTYKQVAIGQGTWRVSADGDSPVTFASLGPLIASYETFIASVVNEEFTLPTDSNSTSGVENLQAQLFVCLSVVLFLLA